MSEVYAGLDISDKQTHISMMDASGAVAWRGKCASDPQAISVMLGKQTSRLGIVLVRAVLETGPLSVFLHHGLRARGVPVVCIRARHAKGVLSTALNKTDVNDAEGLAQLARTGWYEAVHVKDAESHIARAEQKVRARLVGMKTGCKNQLRGLLKVFGLRLGKVTTPAKRAERLEVLFAQEPRLREALGPLVAVLEALEREQSVLDRKLKARAARDAVTRRLMTAPGVGHWVAALYKAGIEDPGRFARSAEVGAYVGLSPKRYQSGEMDYDGGISRRGDKELRHALYEAANSILGRLKRPCALRDRGLALQERKGSKRARVAVARKLAVILHKMWRDEADFDWARA